MSSIEPSHDQLQKLVAAAKDDAPVVMINLLRYRERATYPPGIEAEACSGREAYQRYGMGVAPLLAEAGGRVLWFGSAKQTVIGPETEQWDDAILVQYDVVGERAVERRAEGKRRPGCRTICRALEEAAGHTIADAHS